MTRRQLVRHFALTAAVTLFLTSQVWFWLLVENQAGLFAFGRFYR
jgi:hypothetical protein